MISKRYLETRIKQLEHEVFQLKCNHNETFFEKREFNTYNEVCNRCGEVLVFGLTKEAVVQREIEKLKEEIKEKNEKLERLKEEANQWAY